MRTSKFIVEKRGNAYIAYPLGLKGIVEGQGDSYEQALQDAKSAARSHIETSGGESCGDGDDFLRPYEQF